MSVIIKEVEERNPIAVSAPIDFEDKACDLAISVLDDIAECDGATVYIKWVRLPQTGRVAPLLYVLFRAGIVATSGKELPRVHVGPDGKYHPAHAICLSSQPSGNIMAEDRMRDTIRKGIEQFLRFHGIAITSLIPVLKEEKHA
jgi:hypothetical protein